MKTSVLIFLIVLSSFNLKAQQPKGQSSEYMAKGMVSMLKSRLNLTDQQTENATQIYMSYYKSIDSLRTANMKREQNSKAITSTALMSLFSKAEFETDKKISSILNSNQKVEFAKFVSSRKIVAIATPVSPK